MPDHLSISLLTDYAEGRDPLATAPAAHLATCAQCQHEAVALQRLIGTMRADRSTDPPLPVVARAVHLFRTRFSAPAPRRLFASLRWDSRRTPAVGLRSLGVAPRQALWGVDDYEIDLQIVPDGDERWQITGQLLGPSLAEQAILRGSTTQTVPLDDQQMFTFTALPAGEYSLELSAEALIILALDAELFAG